jgi:hypothetical protein
MTRKYMQKKRKRIPEKWTKRGYWDMIEYGRLCSAEFPVRAQGKRNKGRGNAPALRSKL